MTKSPTIFCGRAERPNDLVILCGRGCLRCVFDEDSAWVGEKVMQAHMWDSHGWGSVQQAAAARRSLEKYRPQVLRQMGLLRAYRPRQAHRPGGAA